MPQTRAFDRDYVKEYKMCPPKKGLNHLLLDLFFSPKIFVLKKRSSLDGLLHINWTRQFNGFM